MSMAAVAIGTTAVAVGGAAVSAGMQMSAADRAARAQGSAGKKYQRQLSQATGTYEQRLNRATKTFQKQQNQLRRQVEAVNPNINIPQYDLGAATLEGIEAANRVTANTLQQLENVAPGSAQARQQVGNIIGSYLRGEVPQDVQEQTARMIAERGGAGFNLATAGRGMGVPTTVQSDFARSIGQTSLGLQQAGMEFNWRNTAQAFNMMARPETYMQFGLQGRGQDINVAEANIRNRMNQLGMVGDINAGIFGAQRGFAQDIYGAQTGQAQTGYGVAQQGIQSTLAARQAAAQGVSDVSQSIGQAGMSGMGAYNQFATARGAGGGMVTGFGGNQYAPQTSATGGQYYSAIGGAF